MGYYSKNSYQIANWCGSSCSADSGQPEPVGLDVGNYSTQGANIQLGTTIDPDFFLNFDYSFYKQKYSSPLDSDLSGYVKTQILSLNFQSDLNLSGPVRYYIGCGIGATRMVFSGAIHGKENGIMYTGKIGMVYLINNDFGLFTEAQYTKGNQTSGDITRGYDIKGYALLLGVRLFLDGRK